MNLIIHLLKPVLITGSVIMLLLSAWSFFSASDYEEDSVTVTFSCEPVLLSQNNYPSFVVTECQKLRGDRR
jgi:hypothetical protein